MKNKEYQIKLVELMKQLTEEGARELLCQVVTLQAYVETLRDGEERDSAFYAHIELINRLEPLTSALLVRLNEHCVPISIATEAWQNVAHWYDNNCITESNEKDA